MSTIPGVMLNLEAGPAGGLPRELGGYIARLSVNAAMAEVNIESMASRWESPRSAEELYEQDGCEAMFNAFGGFEHPNYAPDGSEQSVTIYDGERVHRVKVNGVCRYTESVMGFSNLVFT